MVSGRHWGYAVVPTPHTLPEQSKDWDRQAANAGEVREKMGQQEHRMKQDINERAKLNTAVWLQTKEQLDSSGPPQQSHLQNKLVVPVHVRVCTHTHAHMHTHTSWGQQCWAGKKAKKAK